MRIAVLSDIHGNAVALDAVLADLHQRGIDQIVCLGDAIQGGPQPVAVLNQLRDMGCPVVMGNADAWLLSGIDHDDEPLSAEEIQRLEEVRLWSLAQLSADDQAFIAGFQPTVEIALSPQRRLLCFHGSPASFNDIILPTTPDETFLGLLGAYAPQILAGGHTHTQQIRRLGSSEGFFFNPGSVGLVYRPLPPAAPVRFDPWAEYAILSVETNRIALEFCRVPFDVDALLAAYRSSGRPYAAQAAVEYERA